MANNRFNKQIQTVPEKTSGGKGVMPKTGEVQKSALNMSGPKWPGLPGKAQKDRSAGVKKIQPYAKSEGI